MIKIYLIASILLLTSQLKAQLEYDRFGHIIPFSQVEKYKKKIEAKGIEVYRIPYYNNDSLFRAYNNDKTIEELKNNYVCGFTYDNTPFLLKDRATKIDLGHGTLWLYKIDTKSAGAISVNFKCPSLNKGNYLVFIAADTSLNLIQPVVVYQADDIDERERKRGIEGSAFGKSLIIEYYEPNSFSIGEDIVVDHIIYDFVGFGNKLSGLNNSKHLKSGYWGNSTHPTCQHDISCQEYSNWQNEANSVVLIYLEYDFDTNGDGVDERYKRFGTGFFLNKTGGYADTDNPLILTAGHLYSSESENRIDIVSSIKKFGLVTAYENTECGVDDLKPGIVLSGKFPRIALGGDFNKLPSQSGYSPSRDFAILQASETAQFFALYDIEFAAWSKKKL